MRDRPDPSSGFRARPLSATLIAARAAANRAGVTRLGDVTGLGALGVPTFQAVRPLSRSLSVSQGKGLTRTAAMISALLEAVELDAAERLPPPEDAPAALASLSPDDRALWNGSPRAPLALRLDPAWPRRWLRGCELATGRSVPVPWDLLSLDTTRPPPPDLLPSSVGLATGNTRAEALVGALAELVEHDLIARFDQLAPSERRAIELDTDSVDDPAGRRLLDGMARRGFAVRVWSIGQGAGVPAFWCTLFPASGRSPNLPPVAGSGCHPSRAVALCRALLEAAQSRATLVAGARDDLDHRCYRDAEQRQLDIVLGNLSFGPGSLAWSRVADRKQAAEDGVALLIDVIARSTPLPVLAFEHAQPHPDLHVFHAIAPGLMHSARTQLADKAVPSPRPFTILERSAPRRPVLFAGPSLLPRDVPASIELRPPAICGDLLALLGDPPPAIGLIDGCFELAPTVWHKEVLELVAHGVRVLGAASLGAIRAAELAGLGMEGVGLVFTGYAAGAIRRDDAVMLDHAPAELGYRPLTLSLVDAEATLAATPMAGAERRTLQRIVRTLHYRERTWPLCLERFAARTGVAAQVTARELALHPSLKRRDARLLIGRLLENRPPPSPRSRPPPTVFHRRLLLTIPGAAPPISRHESAADAPAV